MFRQLRTIIIDELHALAADKRGELLSLGLARLGKLAPEARRVGLSATAAYPDALEAYLSPTGRAGSGLIQRIEGGGAVAAEIEIIIGRGIFRGPVTWGAMQ